MRTLTALALGFLVMFAIAGCSATTSSTSKDADAQSVMDSVIPSVFGHWDVNALAAVGDPAVYTPARIGRARTFFHELSQSLGQMVRYNQAAGTTQITGSGADQVKKATYDADVIYQRGSATIHVVAVKKQGKWLVEDASVQPAHHLLVH